MEKPSLTRSFRGRDFPAEALKGSVALLRSKFGDANTTDTSQIFGASTRTGGVSRSKTFHCSTDRSPLLNKYNTAATDQKSNKLSQKDIQNTETNIFGSRIRSSKQSSEVSTADFVTASHCENNNYRTSQPKDDISTSIVVQLSPRTASPTTDTTASQKRTANGEAASDKKQKKRVQVSFAVDTNQSPQSDTSTSHRSLQEIKPSSSAGNTSAEIERTTSSAAQESGRKRFTVSEPVSRTEPHSMADPALVASYTEVKDLEELTLKLKETRDFEERRALRAAIRKLREASSSTTSQTQKQSPSAEDNLPELDLSNYTTEEDLKVLLHQTSKYEDKKRIRAAIRELRKKSDKSSNTPTISDKPLADEESKGSIAKKPSSIENDTNSRQLADKEELSLRGKETNEVFSPPATPDGASLLKNMQLSQLEGGSTVGADDVLVSPVKHESRILERPNGNVKIENFSKHSRTTSHSDVYEKSTKVTTTSKVGDLSISEKDEIITKEKLSLKGSVTTEAEVVRKVDIREKDGSQHIEEEISIEKTSLSKSKAEECQSSLQVSIVREKHPPKILNGLVDLSGTDSKPLTLKCEFEPSEEQTEVSWLKDGIVIQEEEDLAMSWTNGVAEICIKELLYPDDIGQYTCRAKNKYGSVESSAQLTVTEPPTATKLKFSQNLADRTVNDGDTDFTLTCQLSEKAEDAEVTWYKNGKLLKDNSEFRQKFDGSVASLVISEIFPEDSGEYECSVVGGSQEISSFSKVKVKGSKESSPPPVICKTDEKPNSKTKEDSNNNTLTKEETTSTPTNGEVSLSKCERILEAATIKDDTTNGEIKEESTDVKVEAAPSAVNTDSGKTSAAYSKPALKSVAKPGGMSRPTTGKSAAGGSRGAMAAFKQMDTANNPNAGSAPKPNYIRKGNTSNNGLQRSATEIKQILLDWCKSKTAEYENVKIDNFSTSWNNGVAFLALIHHFYPDSFDWAKVDERRRKENFQLAFDLAEKKADIAPLLDVEDMVRMKKPDWKCVFTYVQSFYRKLRDHENNKHTYLQQ